MDEATFKLRTKALGLGVIRRCNALPSTASNDVIRKQLLRSATSVGANYRAACRAKSTADIIAKLAIVEEEADETCYWLDLLSESESLTPESSRNRLREADEIVAMTVASIRTLRSRTAIQNPKSKIQNSW